MTRQDLRCGHKWGQIPKAEQTSPKAPAHQANRRPALSPWQRASRQANRKSVRNLWGIL